MSFWNSSKSFNRIVINGQTYNSVEEMPPEVRRQYEDAMGKIMADRDKNGVPDVFEQPPSDPSHTNVMVTSSTQKFIINGQTFDRLEDIPAELRGQIVDALPSDFEDEGPRGRTLDYRRAALANETAARGGVHLHLSWGTVFFLAAILSALAAWMIAR